MPQYIPLPQAKRLLQTGARRVLVIGCSGGGKSTLSRRLSATYGLPHISMDRDVYWLPGWQMRPKAEIRARLTEIAQRPTWLIDGSGASTMDIRLARTDLILWVRLPRRACLWGLAKRVARYHGQVRAEMAPGCPEKLPDVEFLSYIWTFERKTVPKLLAAIDTHGADVPLAVLPSHRSMNALF